MHNTASNFFFARTVHFFSRSHQYSDSTGGVSVQNGATVVPVPLALAKGDSKTCLLITVVSGWNKGIHTARRGLDSGLEPLRAVWREHVSLHTYTVRSLPFGSAAFQGMDRDNLVWSTICPIKYDLSGFSRARAFRFFRAHKQEGTVKGYGNGTTFLCCIDSLHKILAVTIRILVDLNLNVIVHCRRLNRHECGPQ